MCLRGVSSILSTAIIPKQVIWRVLWASPLRNAFSSAVAAAIWWPSNFIRKKRPPGLQILSDFCQWDGLIPESNAVEPWIGERLERASYWLQAQAKEITCSANGSFPVWTSGWTDHQGIKFRNNIELVIRSYGRYYYEEGADEIVFYDITASSDGGHHAGRCQKSCGNIFIPFSVGGGIRTLRTCAMSPCGRRESERQFAACLSPKLYNRERGF